MQYIKIFFVVSRCLEWKTAFLKKCKGHLENCVFVKMMPSVLGVKRNATFLKHPLHLRLIWKTKDTVL